MKLRLRSLGQPHWLSREAVAAPEAAVKTLRRSVGWKRSVAGDREIEQHFPGIAARKATSGAENGWGTDFSMSCNAIQQSRPRRYELRKRIGAAVFSGGSNMSNRIQQHPLENPWNYNRESFGTLAQIIIAMAEANGNFYTRQIEAAEAAATENSRQLKSLLKKSGEISTALEQWSGLFQSRMANFAEINKAWSKISLATLTEMNELLGSSLPAPAELSQKKPKTTESPKEAAPPPAGERRFMATMIAFPERRAAMLAKAEAKTAGARSHGTASARRSA